MDEKEMMNKIKYLIKKKRSLEDILLETGLKEYEVFGFVEMLKQNGWQAEYKDGFFIYQKEQLIKDRDVYKMVAGEKHKLLFISDTHLGSKYDRLDILRYLYDLAEDEEINTVFHVGDLCDGAYPNRPNHTYELRAHGAEEQLEYIVEKYPSKTGIKTMFIGGNHDYSHVRNAGFDIGKAVAKERPDMIYLGQDVADVDYGKTRLRLFHGSKGQSYARSYRMQKYVEQIPTEEKPDILLMGHYHNSFYMKYADVHCFQVPSTIDQTPYARSLGLNNEKGAWIADLTTDKQGGIMTIEPEFIDFSGQKRLVRRKK
jgi:predicted phosphodiesterase